MPVWPVLALISLGYVFTQQTRLLLTVTGITMAIGLLYWAVFIRPQRDRAWSLKEAAGDELD